MAIQTLLHQRAGTIRRVVRRGAIYLCGLCRRQYSDEEEAHECVVSCWAELLTLDPVLRRPALAAVNFRCRFCARDHRTKNLANACARDCRRKQIGQFEAESELGLDGEGLAPRPKRVFGRRPAPVVKPVVPPWRKAEPPVEAPAATVPPPPPPSAVAAPAAAPPAPPAPAPAADTASAGGSGKTYRDADVFTRDGARYICRVCKKKHFTREDVVSCFESHSAEGGAPP